MTPTERHIAAVLALDGFSPAAATGVRRGGRSPSGHRARLLVAAAMAELGASTREIGDAIGRTTREVIKRDARRGRKLVAKLRARQAAARG